MEAPNLSSVPPPFASQHFPPPPAGPAQLSQHMTPTTPFPQSLSAAQLAAEGADRARAYKSRNKRPCDFCRYKKAACHLESHPPCELCIRYNKECTFVESPAKRRRPNDSNGTDNGTLKSDSAFGSRSMSIGQSTFGNGNGMDMQQELLSWESAMPPFQMSGMGMGGAVGGDFGPFDPALYHNSTMSFDAFDPMSASTVSPMDNHIPQVHHRSPVETSPSSQSATMPLNLQLPFDSTSGEPSLDNQASSNAQVIGLSGESDPYLLSRFRFDQYNEATFQSIRVRKMNAGAIFPSSIDARTDGMTRSGVAEVPTFFTLQHNALASKAQPPERLEILDQYRREVEEMISDDVGKRLMHLFYKYVQPYFPILSRQHGLRHDITSNDICDPSDVPTSILAAIYGHALAFCAWDEKLCVEVYTPPSADSLFKLAWLSCMPNLHTPNIAVLQTLLLLVQRRPTNKHVSDTPFKWVMMTTAVSIAQALGINRDPTDWPLPAWEIKLRKRLGWATFVQDKWLALNFGRSSHIQTDDWDVDLLTPNDFEEPDRYSSDPMGGEPETSSGCLHFIKLCELTVIVDDVLRRLFHIRATRALQGSLESTLEVAKPLRLRLTEWYQQLPSGILPPPPHNSSSNSLRNNLEAGKLRRSSTQHELDGNGSLHLAYITAKIELFRAMLRPRVTDATAVAVTALRTGAVAVAKEVFEFLEGLNARELEAFWASYSRTNFTIATSFMLLLFVTAPTPQDAKECLALLNAWRSLLRLKSRSCDLLNLALLRLDGVFVAGIEKLIELSPPAAQVWAEASGQTGLVSGERGGKG